MKKYTHVLNIRAAIKKSGKKYNEISEAMGAPSNTVSSAIKRFEERQKEIENRMEPVANNTGKKPQSGGFRLEFLEHLADAIGCDFFDLWETRDEEGNVVELYPNVDTKTEKSESSKSIPAIGNVTAHELTFEDALNTPQNVEIKDGIITCPHCGQVIKPFQFFK